VCSIPASQGIPAKMFKQVAGRKQERRMLLTAQPAIIQTQRQEIRSIIHMLEDHMQQFFSMKANFICFTFVILFSSPLLGSTHIKAHKVPMAMNILETQI